MKIEQNLKKIKPNKREAMRFAELAGKFVDTSCTALDGEPLVGDQRASVIAGACWDMASGANAVKKYYFRKGLVVGIVLAGGVWFYTYTQKEKSEKK